VAAVHCCHCTRTLTRAQFGRDQTSSDMQGLCFFFPERLGQNIKLIEGDKTPFGDHPIHAVGRACFDGACECTSDSF
jgi:hypothetical protein